MSIESTRSRLSTMPVKEILRSHPRWAWAGGIGVGLLTVLVLFWLIFDWNMLRPALARAITAHTGRAASVGDLKVHPWSWNPSAEIKDLQIENPDWADQHLMFGAKLIRVSINLGHLLRGQIVIPRIDLVEPEINLERDSRGRASWELGTQGTPKANAKPAKLPTVQGMTIVEGKLHVADKIRKLKFSGSLVAAEQMGKPNDSAFQIRSRGTLNAKPFRLEADGGPLFVLEPDKPYSFSAKVTASDINLDTRVTVLKPFDLGLLDVKFAVSGEDLADVYYLTGLALPNTPKYRVSGTMHVDKTRYTIDDLRGRLGSSDIAGHVQVQTAGARPKLTGKLTSSTLNIADMASSLGRVAPAGKSLSSPNAVASTPTPETSRNEAAEQSNTYLFPDSELQLNRVRGMDADVTYAAGSVVAPKMPMKHVNLHLTLDNGLLRLDPLEFVLDQGRFHGTVQIDARKDVPVSDINMRIDDVELSQFKPAAAKQAPMQGVLLGRVDLRGEGNSIHKFASTSTGNLSLVIPHGQINEAMAEFTGIDVLHGLGLLLSKKQSQADIRCGVVDFKDQSGNVNTTTVFVDTSNVLITGRGRVNLGQETLDLSMQGDPKKLRLLRIRSPIVIHGTLRHPAVGVKPEKLAAQAGVAAALATLLTPVAAILALIDPGLAKDKDCSTVLQQAEAGVQN